MGPIAFGGSRNATRLQSVFAVPFILAGGTAGGGLNQFTMGNNGALSTLATLPTTYSGGAWIYMPANAIQAGSAAGWYWFVASSTTAGTVFNNTYTTGDPVTAIPAAPTAFVSTGPGLVTQSTAELLAAEILLPAGAMGANGHVRALAQYTHISNANNKTFRCRLGATQGALGTGFQVGNATTSVGSGAQVVIANRNSASAQFALNATFGVPGGAGAAGYGTANTNANTFLQQTMQLANAADFIVLEAMSVEVLFRQ